jgi:hypothetical protein
MEQKRAGTEREERADNDNRQRSKAAPTQRAVTPTPETPGLRQRWDKAKASKTVVFWVAVAAVVLVIFVGFTWGGWVTGGSALTSSRAAAQVAVIERLAPICVAQFNQDPLKDEKLAELQTVSSFQRSAFVREQGWATMPGEDGPDNRVSDACARLIIGE